MGRYSSTLCLFGCLWACWTAGAQGCDSSLLRASVASVPHCESQSFVFVLGCVTSRANVRGVLSPHLGGQFTLNKRVEVFGIYGQYCFSPARRHLSSSSNLEFHPLLWLCGSLRSSGYHNPPVYSRVYTPCNHHWAHEQSDYAQIEALFHFLLWQLGSRLILSSHGNNSQV